MMTKPLSFQCLLVIIRDVRVYTFQLIPDFPAAAAAVAATDNKITIMSKFVATTTYPSTLFPSISQATPHF